MKHEYFSSVAVFAKNLFDLVERLFKRSTFLNAVLCCRGDVMYFLGEFRSACDMLCPQGCDLAIEGTGEILEG